MPVSELDAQTPHEGEHLLRDGLRVNAFLGALAQDQGENAIGIVLSGTGSDGALGIAAVKKHGGNTFAQVPGDARYEGMPTAAIATGMVEQVLPAAEIPAALVELAAERRRHPSERARAEEEGVRQALDVVELAPEVVLCDIGLPGMDGYAVAKALRHAPALRDTFIVALTGHALADDRRSASEAGFDAHLTKPATIAEIEQVIARAARRQAPRADGPGLSPPPAVA